mmetsp:Transcript_20367/g.46201  ORF Transcript_20367/g.46201 Transcript_20367/m.46201 type:complete len:149 (+) Transcript_20367:458-904(+)
MRPRRNDLLHNWTPVQLTAAVRTAEISDRATQHCLRSWEENVHHSHIRRSISSVITCAITTSPSTSRRHRPRRRSPPLKPMDAVYDALAGAAPIFSHRRLPPRQRQPDDLKPPHGSPEPPLGTPRSRMPPRRAGAADHGPDADQQALR